MIGYLRTLSNNFNYVFYDLNDDRMRNIWPNAHTLLAILLAYLYFIKVVGPAWMKDRKPYNLKKTILVYNVFQIIASFYVFYGASNVWVKDYNWTCQPVDYSNTPVIKKRHNLMWLYMALKIIDLLDTVFFVLRKKNKQISALHVYHHLTMPFCAWIGVKFYPDGHSTLIGVVNCFVHIIMYTYYLIAGLGPQYQKYLWWKKHVTTLQLMQFVIIFFHNLYPLFNECSYPKWINATVCLCSFHYVYMFGNFYYVNYIKNKREHKKKQ